jgi:hypothetical protein
MNESEVAFKILNRRNSVSPIVMIGELQDSLGQAGYELAMERRWVEPNYDSGELSITESFEKLEELRALASQFKDAPKSEAPKVNNIYGRFASHIPVAHVVEAFGAPTAGGVVEIGDEVAVAENGQPIRAVVKSRKPDGTFELSFQDKDKPKVERSYRAEELKRLNAGPKPAATGAGAAPAAPAA